MKWPVWIIKISFRFVSLNETLDGVNKLNPKNALQAIDIPVKIIKKTKALYHFTFSTISTMHYQVALF